MAQTERNIQGRQETVQGNYEICKICPLRGEEGHVLHKSRRCETDSYLICSRILGESTTPKKSWTGLAQQPGGEFSRWWKKNRIPRD